MSDEKRPYRKTRRAEAEEETRRRIAASAMELHGTVGPARTSISAVAERAGVRRSTVYRHFPDEAALFAACSAHFDTLVPPPDPSAWAQIADPGERLRRVLADLYGYYGRAGSMLVNVSRDAATMEVLVPFAEQFRGFLDWTATLCLEGRAADAAARAALGHALALSTHTSLTAEQGLDDAAAAALMGRIVEAVAPAG